MKRIITLLIFFILSIVVNMPLFAVNRENEVHNLGVITPYFTNVSYAKADLNIESNGTAHAQTIVTARNVDKIIINMSLQKNEAGNWKILKTWTKTVYSTESILYTTLTISRGHSYRIVSNTEVFLENKLLETIKTVSESSFF